MSTEQTTILGWHFSKRAVLAHGDGRALQVGETYSIEPPITCCTRGLHALARVQAAWRNVKGRLLCRVALSGALDRKPEKIAAQYRRVLDIRIVTRSDIVRLRAAIATAEQAYQTARATAEFAWYAALPRWEAGDPL